MVDELHDANVARCYIRCNSGSLLALAIADSYCPTMDIKMIRRANLKGVRARFKTQREFADATDSNPLHVSQMLTGKREVGDRVARRIEQRLNLPYGYMDSLADEPAGGTPLASTARREPIAPGEDFLAVRRVRLKLSAGVSGFAIEFDNDDAPPIFFRREWFDKNALLPDKLIALRVQGHSMEPGLYDGDVVVVNTADQAPSDGDVFALNYEGELVIKRLKRDGGEWWITSDNQDRRRFPDKRCHESALLIGRVVYKGSERI